MPRKPKIQPITEEQRSELKSLLSARTKTSRQMSLRIQIVLLRSDGVAQEAVAARLGVVRQTVVTWEQRFASNGIAGLADKPGRGRKESIPTEVKEAILTQATRPIKPIKRWSTRKMAAAKGVSNATVQRLWNANGIKPHVTKGFKVSNDPDFEAKFWDVVGLYLNPPDKALVLCCDEKTQCQALERTQLSLPMRRGGLPETATHDYKRNGTLTLFASLNYLEGKVFGVTGSTHTHKDWLDFLKLLNKEYPDGVTLHIVQDNYATHKHAKVKSWINWCNGRHRKAHGVDRLVSHFTPTSSSWLNLVERFFGEITADVIRHGSFASIKELSDDIMQYLADRTANPKRYVWKAEGEVILAKIKRAREALANIKMTS
jgi:transposase